ncbi:GEVED domain-containing protein [Amniculibacterium aquaticum]|uniref:GEVED domain-containing protein n=1 Tax=Amniculibacterium aquaticum TaxID=2479858 RepID=UPI000F5A5844|nr:GEVED domain-containing protein [Amniculibacterium aquaticum]
MKRFYYLAALVLTAYQLNAQTYCTPTYDEGCSDGDMIDSFSVPSASYQHLSTGCSTGAYGDYYATETITIQAGVSTAYQVTHGFGSQKVKIWIDFNNDGIFANDATETVSSASASGNTTNGNILIPGNVTPGTYRMRVGDRYSQDPVPCDNTSFAYGEAHDYKVVVTAAPSCLTPSAILTSGATATTVNLAWTAPTTVPTGGYDLYYSTSSTPSPDAATTPLVTGLTGTSTVVTGLQPSTQYYFWLRSNCTSEQSPWVMGNSSTTLTFCPSVTSPANAANGQSLTPTISWTAVTGATNYNITVGSTPGASDVLAGIDLGNVTSYTFATPLTTNTTYYYTINADNGTVYSNSCTERSFTTMCDPYTIPYFEGFESGYVHDTPVTGCLAQASIEGGGVWRANNTYTTYNRTPRTGSWNTFLQYGNKDWLFIPIQLTAGTTYSAKVYARQDSSTPTYANVSISYGTSSTAAAMTNVIAPAVNIINGDYQKVSGNFTVPTTGTYVVGIKGEISSSPWYLSMDDISIEEVAGCLEPSAIAASNVTGATATLSWNAPAGPAPASYDVYYSTSDVDPTATTTPTWNGTATTTNLSALTPNTVYYVWVRSNCGAAQSVWEALPSFMTGQIPASLPYTQDFSGTNDMALINGTQTNQWFVGTAEGNPAGSLYVTNDGGTTNAYDTASTTAVHAYRDIAVPAGTTLSTLSFDWKAQGESASYDYLRVFLVPTSFNPTPGTKINTTTGITQIGGVFNQQSSWQNYVNANVDLSAFAGQTVRLLFEWWNDGSGGTNPPAAVDNINLMIPTCVAPTGLSIANVTNTSGTVNWTAPTPAPGLGYDVYSSTTNTAPTATTTPTASVTATTYNMTGLTMDTSYFVWVRSSCTASDKSTWSGPIEVRTGYCGPTGGASSQLYYLGNVSTTGGVTNLAYTASSYQAYDNQTATTFSGVQGAAITVNLLPSSADAYYYIWVDWNNDMKFDGPGESVLATTSYATSATGTINIPAAQTPGNYRVRMAESYIGTLTPCGPAAYGNYVDFTLSVGALATAEVAAKDSVKIYPNPFVDVLHISDVREVRSISIVDASGRLVKTIAKPTAELQLGDLKTGLYMVTLHYKDGSVKTVKAMKK